MIYTSTLRKYQQSVHTIAEAPRKIKMRASLSILRSFSIGRKDNTYYCNIFCIFAVSKDFLWDKYMAIGKWIGGFLGLLNGGPLGALAGFALGSLFDTLTARNVQPTYIPDDDSHRTTESEGQRNGFLFSLMVLSADVIQADGRIMHSEMECLRNFLRNQFGSQAVTEGEQIIRRLFERRKQMGETWWRSQIDACCRQIAQVMTVGQRLQLVSYLVLLAKADGTVSPDEIQAIKNDAANMDIDPANVDQMTGLGGKTLDDAYKVLGISPDATDDEVRTAYRQMALKHHPDRVATLGEDVRKAAEKKFQEINDAKDRIYKARGIKK